MLYFVEHTDPMLREFYLFTDEKEPQMYNSYLCFLMEIKTLYLIEYQDQSRVFVKSRYVKKLVPMNDFPVEEMFGDPEMMKRFLFTIGKMYENI